jgi:CPA2 family monovalent cation:H+ antiporter-2
LNPLLFAVAGRVAPKVGEREKRAADKAASAAEEPLPVTNLSDHAVLVGYGRVGSIIGEALKAQGTPFLVVEEKRAITEALRKHGIDIPLSVSTLNWTRPSSSVIGLRASHRSVT